jgi:FkbM family methyltransferase
MIRAVLKRLLRRSGWELRRVGLDDLPRLERCQAGEERFPFWIANRHTEAWWGRGQIRFDAELAFLRSVCQPGATVLEVGAHHGMHAVQMARWVAPGGTVHAFESNAENALVLAANAGIGRHDNLIVLNAAAAEKDGFSAIAGERVAASGRSVPAVSLDGYCERMGIGRVDLLKVDVEGYEGFVLRGAREVMARARAIALELHLNDLVRYGDSVAAIWDLLPRDRLRIEVMQRPDWFATRPLDKPEDLPASGVLNLFLSPKERA